MKYEAEQIEQLMIDQLAGTISAEDEAILKKTIEEDAEVAQLWQDYSNALLLYRAENQNWNKNKAWETIQKAIRQKEKAAVVPFATRKKLIILSVSAAACLLVIVAATLFLVDRKTATTGGIQPKKLIEITLANGKKIELKKGGGIVQTETAQFVPDSNALHYSTKNGLADTSMNTLSVPPGLDYALTLSDGTKVWINAATLVRFPLYFSNTIRKVELDGEAYFEVSKDKLRPFIVHTQSMDIQVYGTSFNVKAYHDEAIQASLVEGKVEARTSSGNIILSPGKAAVLSGRSLNEIPFDARMVLAWRKGYYFFRNESIASINNTVERWFGYHLQYDQREIAQIRFTGALEKAETLQSFLSRFASSANLKFTIKENTVVLQHVK